MKLTRKPICVNPFNGLIETTMPDNEIPSNRFNFYTWRRYQIEHHGLVRFILAYLACKLICKRDLNPFNTEAEKYMFSEMDKRN